MRKFLLATTLALVPGFSFAQGFTSGWAVTPPNGVYSGKQFQATPPIAFTDAAHSAILYYNGNVSGNITETPSFYSGILIAGDTATNTGAVNVFETVENVRAGATGTRNGIMSKMNVLGTPGDTGQWYVAVEGDSFASTNAGGTSWAAPSGALRGAEFGTLLGSGATYWNQTGALELSAGISAGASAQFRTILAIEAAGGEAVRGNSFDSGISFWHEAPTTPGLGYGIAFGHPGHRWYFAPDSVLIGAIPRTMGFGGGNAVPLLADRGVDFSKVAFTTASMALPGASFDPTGQLLIANAKVTRTAFGVAIDIPNLLVTAVSVATTGAGYLANDLVYETTSGSILKVTSVDGGGHILGLVLLVPGALSTAPSGSLAVIGGNGTNATVNITTAPQNVLALNPTGGPVTVGAPTTVSRLPTCNTAAKYQVITVTDANTPSYGAPLQGKGSTPALALCDGTNWTAH